MKFLLDTHVLIWWLTDAHRLSVRARSLIRDPKHDLFWSAASTWEVVIKESLGQIRFADSFRAILPRALREQSIESLAIEQVHAFEVGELSMHHRDPFDRMLVAQCRVNRLAVLSSDLALDAYGVDRHW